MAQISYGTITVTDVTDVKRIQNWYLATDLTDSNQVKPSNLPASGHGSWTRYVSEAQVSSSMPYLWNYEQILGEEVAGVEDYVISTTDPVMIGMYSEDGRGITSIEEWYQTTNSTNNPGSNGWTDDPTSAAATLTSTKKYLWNYQVIHYSDNTSAGSYSDARIIGVYGDTGRTTVTVYLYKRSSTILDASSKPTGELVYNFANATITPTPISNGWVQSLSELNDSSDPIWVITAIANTTNTTTVTLTSSDWSTPKKLVENGTDGVGIIRVEELYYLQTEPTYAITYQYSGTIPSGAPEVPAQARYKEGATVTVAASPTMVSHTFSGWKRNNSVVTSFTMPATDVTLTGSWTAKSSYNVTYQYSGTVPSGAPAVPTRQTRYVGEEVTVEPKPSLDGYVFSGWYRNGQEVSSFTMPSSSVTLTGSWTSVEAPTYNVTYSYTNTPSGAPALPAQASYHEGETVTIAATPTLTGYTFSGWKRNGNVVSTSFVMPGEDVSITGTWTAKTQYTVTYQYTGTIPSGAPAVPSQQTYYSGDTVTVASAPTMSGYTFSGWSRTGTFTISSNVTITGSWTASSVPTYTVTYQYTNAPSGVSPPTQQSYQQGTTVTLPTPSSVSGYTFNGWTSSQVTISNNRFTMPAYAVTITGSWTSTSPSEEASYRVVSKTLTTAANSITFTNLLGEPTSFIISAKNTLNTGASPWKTAAVVFDGTNLFGQTIRNTSNAQVTYDGSSFTKTYNNGTLTVTGSGTNFQAIEYELVYSYGGSSNNIGYKTVSVGSGATNITFTGLEGIPMYFSCVFKSNFSTSNGYQRVIANWAYDGDIFGLEMDSSAKYSNSHWTYNYDNGSLTIRSSGTNAGGYFHQPGSYQLTYAYYIGEELRSVNNTKGSIETKGEIKSDDEIEIKSDEIIETKGLVLTKGATLRAGATLEPPSAPYHETVPIGDSHIVTTTSDVTDTWTLTVPTYVEDGIYYTCLQIYYDNSTVNWSTVSRNQGLTDANARASEALEVAGAYQEQVDLLGGHFIYVEDENPTGAAVVQNTEGPSSGWGHNVFIGSSGIKLRYNNFDYSVWYTNSSNNNQSGIKFYAPPTLTNGTYSQGLEVASLTTGDGLVLAKGGIKAGDYTNNPTKFIYLSTEDYSGSPTVTINNNSSGWRQIIGNKFGVKNDGTLYANNAVISGQIIVGAGSNLSAGLGAYSTTESMQTYVTGLGYQTAGNVSDAINNIQIGGRNLLLAQPKSYSATAYCAYQVNLAENLVAGQQYTLQLWGVTLDANSAGIRPYWGGGNVNLISNESLVPDANGYISYTFTITSAQASHADASNMWLNIYNWPSSHSNKNMSMTKWKLEVGNKVTDWSPAHEDVINYTDEQVANVQVGGRNLHKDSANIGSSWTIQNGTNSSGTVTLTRTSSETRIYQMPANGYWSWEANTDYVASIEAKGNAGGESFQFVCNGGGTVTYHDDNPTLTTSWKRYSRTFTTGSSTSTGSMSYVLSTNNSTIQIRNPKLEKGNKTTEWTPAPEDVQNEIDNIQVGGRNYAATCFGEISIGTSITRGSGVTATMTAPATFVLNGSATTTDWFFSSGKCFGGIELDVGTYLIWHTSENVRERIGYGDSATYVGSTSYCTKDEPYIFTVSTKQVYWFTPHAESGKSYSNQEVKLMIEKASKPSDWTPAPEDVQNEIDNIQVGGRNLLQQNNAIVDNKKSLAYKICLSEPLVAGQPYVLQLWDVTVARSGRTADTLGIDIYYCGTNVKIGGWHGTTYFTTINNYADEDIDEGTSTAISPAGKASYLNLIFVPYDDKEATVTGGNQDSIGTLSNADSSNTPFIYIYNSLTSGDQTQRLYIGNYKLEKGNKPTEWTQAPEDIEINIANSSSELQNLINMNNSLLQELNKTINFEEWLKQFGDWTQITDTEAIAEDGTVYYELINLEFEEVENIEVGVTNVYKKFIVNNGTYTQIMDPEAIAESNTTYYTITFTDCIRQDVIVGETQVYGLYILDLVTTPLTNFLNSYIVLNEYGILIKGENNNSQLQIYNNGIQIQQDNIPIASFSNDIVLGNQEKAHIVLTPDDGTENHLSSLIFNDGDIPVAYINSSILGIKQAEIENNLRIGDFKWQTDNSTSNVQRISLVYSPK